MLGRGILELSVWNQTRNHCSSIFDGYWNSQSNRPCLPFHRHTHGFLSTARAALWSVMKCNFSKDHFSSIVLWETPAHMLFSPPGDKCFTSVSEQRLPEYCSFWKAASRRLFLPCTSGNGTHQETNRTLTASVVGLSITRNTANFSNDWPSDVR